MRTSRSAFTLVELLVVIAVLALVSGIAVTAYQGAQEKAEAAMAERQLDVLRDALLRFRSDMGFFPGEGPLAAAQLDLSDIGGRPRSPRWAEDPANFWMLFEMPRDRQDANRWRWKPEVARGWRGPYLDLNRQAFFHGRPANGETLADLFAIGDLLPQTARLPEGQFWGPDQAPEPATRPPRLGLPLLFESDPAPPPGWRVLHIRRADSVGSYTDAETDPLTGEPLTREVTRIPTQTLP